MRSNYLWVGVCAAILAGASVPIGSAAEAGEVPRYRFEAGQEITYRTDWTIRYWTRDRSSLWNDHIEVVARVVRENKDGSFRIICTEHQTRVKTVGKDKTEMPASDSMFYLDVFPDGRELPIRSAAAGALPGMLFPPLPKDAVEMNNGWTGAANNFNYICKPEKSDAGFAFSVKIDSPVLKVLNDSRTGKFVFDAKQGFMSRSDDSLFRHSSLDGAGGGTTQLAGLKNLTPQELQLLATQSDAFFEAVEAYETRMQDAQNAGPEGAGRIAGVALAELKKQLSSVSEPDLRAEGEREIRDHEAWTKSVVATAELRTNRIGQPAADFDTTDVDGKKVRLLDFRGKVVVLDFWYRGCAWCVKVTPQMNQLAEDFTGKPVAVLGMSIDHDLADSLFVIKQLGIKYPTLRAEGLAERFGVQGYPTLIVIDAQGIVRKIDAGYSPTMREDVGKVIRGLLGS